MGLSALSSPTNGLHGNSLDRLGNKRLSTPDDLDDSSSVWHPRPVDRESMARITQYFTQASLSTHGDIDFDEPKASRSLGYLNTIASETSTEDEFAAEMSFHNAGAKSQPRLVHYVDNSDVHPTIVVDFRPIEPMPTSPSARPKSKGKSIGVSPSISVDRIPKISAKSKNFVQEARELYRSHFGAPSHDYTVLYSEYEFDEPVHHHHHHKQDPTDYQISAHQVYNKGSSFWKSYHAPEVMTAKSHPSSSSVQQPEEPRIDKDKYKLRPTLQTPPFPTDLTLSPKLAVYSGTAYKEASMEQDSVYDGASSSSVITESYRNSVPMQRSEKVEDQQQENQPLTSSSKTNTTGGIEKEQYKRHSRHSSHPSFGANKDIPDINKAAVIPDPPAYRQIFPDVQVQSEHIRSQQLQQQQKKDFSCCSLGKDLQKQQQMFGPQEQTPVPETSVKAPSSPGKKRHSRHYRSNSTPFPSPCNFIDLLADDPNTPRDPYNHYHMTASQPSLANANSSDRISSHSVNEFSNIRNNKVTTSCSAGNIPRGTTTPSDSEMKEESATLGKQPKKQRYIKHKKSPSNHSCGALSGLTASSSSGTTLAASSGKSSETLRPDEQSPVSLESRLQYFFRQQAAAEGLIPSVDSTLEHHTANSNLGVGQILPSLLSPSGRGSSYSVTGELMLGLQPGIGHESLVLNVLRAKDLSDQFIDLTKKREWHCLVSYQDYNKSRTKQFRSHAVKAIYDPVFHEIFGFKVNGLEGLVQVKLLCRKGIFSQKKKVGSIYLCLERIPFENCENGELIAWYKLLKKR